MTPEQAKIVEIMGFEICEFGPDSDPCEGCEESHHQLYFQGPSDAGRYLCLECILLEHSDNQREYAEVVRLEKEGHTYRCSAQQVWDDGACVCRDAAGDVNAGISINL